MSFSHFNEDGRARMVNVQEKLKTARKAVAQSKIRLSNALYTAIHDQSLQKGDPLSVAQVAGVMAAKKTPDWIPMCHPIMIQGTDIDFRFEEDEGDHLLVITATVTVEANTGVEMEALTAVSASALTFYDMCKSIDKGMIIEETLLLTKTGGKNGDFHHPRTQSYD
ncbi:cyclic pyranopterin monophosphate synthase MoaC [Geomicrobium sp. JCM 19055]|uniref:cyclic pyranopterin monophosphate synthase MoaC n=1 Tax=Geomicrobium sp. JCM 19055 TaxID=1460649 RepID=UPI00045EDB3A|nr:cyclic pyranopterin monophosphate synthase MoaC [Geomicrobium sp. JCM 19055]GAK00483.1 molybdenum cofactor biosynthesis protein MoaC [Geomicrobium sp. JCM 19055]